MSQKLPLNNFELIKEFIKIYNEESDKGYLLELDVQYLEKLHDLHNDLPFQPKIMKIDKLITNLHDKTEYVMHIGNLKQALDQ